MGAKNPSDNNIDRIIGTDCDLVRLSPSFEQNYSGAVKIKPKRS